jgi:hypothetical protein
MTETDERAGDDAANVGGTARESSSTGEEAAAGQRTDEKSEPRADEEAELRAEEESAKAMEAEVPHPPGYEDPGQEPPSESE